MADNTFPRNMVEFEDRFPTEAACRRFFFERRWPDGWTCPKCRAERGWLNARGRIECARCGYQAGLTAGTLFHGTRKGLRLWFKAILLLVTQKNGLSARSLQHALGISYPTAWTWLQKLRHAMAARPCDPLIGAVELDDATVGGYHPGEPGRQKGGGKKALVLVAVEAKGPAMGRVRLRWLPDHRKATVTAAAERCIAPGSRVHTDGLSSYNGLEAAYVRERTVVGSNSPRAVEALPKVHRVISLLKRWLLGTHQGAVRSKHLPGYLAEFEFRFNRRTSTHRTLLFERIIDLAMRTAAPTYRALTDHDYAILHKAPA